ncbi:MAG TPA: hypothetical protein VGH33_01545 [Isosphaeraceae bacterium]|jgi:hypothetical protein
MIYRKSPDLEPQLFEPLKSWGQFTRYLEIGDDAFATRHIDVFANGCALRYDRVHWVDGFGTLAEMRYDAKKWAKWWGPSVAIPAEEFEAVWRAAQSSPTWEEQARTARMSKDGVSPIWLARRDRA